MCLKTLLAYNYLSITYKIDSIELIFKEAKPSVNFLTLQRYILCIYLANFFTNFLSFFNNMIFLSIQKI